MIIQRNELGAHPRQPDAGEAAASRQDARPGLLVAPRLLVADDHLLLLDTLAALLRQDFTVVGTANCGKALIEMAARLLPDIALVDVGMPDVNGIEAGASVRRLSQKTSLVFMTMDPDPHLAATAFAEGASGYVLKSDPAGDMLNALHTVAAGGSYLSKAIVGGDIMALAPLRRGRLAKLSPREHDVLRYTALGLPMKEVARRLRISPRTVAFHKYRGMTALGLRGHAELLSFALQHGLIDRGAANLVDSSTTS